MFGMFRKDPVKALEKQYAQKLEEARDLQRKGDIVAYSRLTAEADEILQQIEAAEAKSAAPQ